VSFNGRAIQGVPPTAPGVPARPSFTGAVPGPGAAAAGRAPPGGAAAGTADARAGSGGARTSPCRAPGATPLERFAHGSRQPSA